jgi:hypothetical protein
MVHIASLIGPLQNLKAARQLRPRGATQSGVDLQVDVLLLSLLRIARAASHVSTIPLLRQVVKIDCNCCCLSGYRPQYVLFRMADEVVGAERPAKSSG